MKMTRDMFQAHALWAGTYRAFPSRAKWLLNAVAALIVMHQVPISDEAKGVDPNAFPSSTVELHSTILQRIVL